MTIFLTASRRKRIRRADARDIAWMVNKEHYWSEEALEEILRRIRSLCHEDPVEAEAAGRSALEILQKRMINPPPNLVGVALGVYGNTLRCVGRFDEALETYEQALRTENLGPLGRSDILGRMTVTLVCLERLDEGLEAVNQSLDLNPGNLANLAIRGWVHMVRRDTAACLQDCLTVIRDTTDVARSERPFISAIVNAANVLSHELSGPVDASTLQELETAISTYRDSLPRGGSSFYRLQKLRHYLSRAQALLQARSGNLSKAVVTLRPVAKGLRERFPDEALDAHVDLMCLLAKLGRGRESMQEVREISSLLRETTLPPSAQTVALLGSVLEKSTLSPLEAVELRMILRARHQRRKVRVA